MRPVCTRIVQEYFPLRSPSISLALRLRQENIEENVSTLSRNSDIPNNVVVIPKTVWIGCQFLYRYHMLPLTLFMFIPNLQSEQFHFSGKFPSTNRINRNFKKFFHPCFFNSFPSLFNSTFISISRFNYFSFFILFLPTWNSSFRKNIRGTANFLFQLYNICFFYAIINSVNTTEPFFWRCLSELYFNFFTKTMYFFID